METSAATMVPSFRHVPGNHCGSTALRNLLAFHGLEMSEAMAFGLAAGPCFYYIVVDGTSPSRFTNGRTAQLESLFVELTGAPLDLLTTEDRDHAWEAARQQVDAGRPVLLLTDLYYLDHYGKSAHFPGHAVILAGYDDEVAYLSDTSFDELQTTKLENLADARFSKQPIFQLDGHMYHLPEGAELGDLRDSAAGAISYAAQRMIEPPLGEYEGLPALRRFAEEVGSWPEATEDWQWCARFGYQVIERRGTGGGNFRKMYAEFLSECGYAEAALCQEASDLWTELAGAFREASERDDAEPAVWEGIGARANAVLEAETSLWESLSAD